IAIPPGGAKVGLEPGWRNAESADYADGRRWVRVGDEGVGSGGDRVIAVDCIATLAPPCGAGLWCCEGEAGPLAVALASPPVPLPMLWGGGTAEECRGSRAGHGGTPRSTEPTTTSPEPRPSRPTAPVHGSSCSRARTPPPRR